VFVRGQLGVLVLTSLIALAMMGLTSVQGRRVIARWTLGERLGVAVLVLGALIWLGALANHHSYAWTIGAHFHHRMFTYGLWAFGAFVIGIGILPAFAALTWLLSSRFETPEERALAGVLLGARSEEHTSELQSLAYL